ncbi:ABC transporter ATP-binding protein [Clostridioides sp. ES-S-0123-01]|uniref:ABC transporter ATP-binding protein n=1 Tax=unclassified Clostridioides TaxID=2635829 RepID=UPI001D10296A|nr:ABC transporter ATP-binding protein [Clostridioides sp. ES-S-0123-01]MCC0674388.1 ABC transporter ATP-binding protein [Clostridioides sp. ES-S-0145-01]
MENVLLEIEKLSKRYKNKEVVSRESFKILEGDILGFIGPNGAGKSTSINMFTTIVSPDSGDIYYKGKSIKNQQNVFKSDLGVVPQELAIYEDLSAYDNVKFFCSLYGFRGNELKSRTKEALEFVGLWGRHKELPSKFSGGMKRRLNIACAIAHSPKILIMDEPTVGIDPQSRNKIMEAIKTINKNGTTIIYTSHYMEEIEALCNRIILIDEGVILEDLDKSVYKDKYLKLGFKTLEDIFLYLTGTNLRDSEE